MCCALWLLSIAWSFGFWLLVYRPAYFRQELTCQQFTSLRAKAKRTPLTGFGWWPELELERYPKWHKSQRRRERQHFRATARKTGDVVEICGVSLLSGTDGPRHRITRPKALENCGADSKETNKRALPERLNEMSRNESRGGGKSQKRNRNWG